MKGNLEKFDLGWRSVGLQGAQGLARRRRTCAAAQMLPIKALNMVVHHSFSF